MKRLFIGVALTFLTWSTLSSFGGESKHLVTGLTKPVAVAVGQGGKVYVAVAGKTEQDGEILVVQNGKAVSFSKKISEPRGMAAGPDGLYVVGKRQVWRIDFKGQTQVLSTPESFPKTPVDLHGIAYVPTTNSVCVTDAGDADGKGGAIYRIPTKGGKPAVVTSASKWNGEHAPHAIVSDGNSRVIFSDAKSGALYEVRLADGSMEKIGHDFGVAGSLAWDYFGRLFVTDHKAGRLLVRPRPDQQPVVMSATFPADAAFCTDAAGTKLLVVDPMAGTLSQVEVSVPGFEVDTTPLPIATAQAFPDIKWAGWGPEDAKGNVTPFRPIMLTGAHDGTNRVFVGTQNGVVHVLANDQKVTKSDVFLDWQSQAFFGGKQDEQGFLGIAFHPKFKDNGEFFIFYTSRKDRKFNIVSRMKTSKDDPNKADPNSEEILLRIERPFNNHNGGTICFGPDGYLYIVVGDGGAGGDPNSNGQNLNTLLAKILRIDVDHKEEGKNYAIPKDNPFAGRSDARGEVWSYGHRNPWRISFDTATGRLWDGEVGQDIFEEINIIEKGGNYGWGLREGMHPFEAKSSRKGASVNDKMIEPIWEYSHDVGRSLTGGHVYRGSRLPELQGTYLYGDYVYFKMWGLRYDEKLKRVTANQPIADRRVPIYSFGQDDDGEVYFMTETAAGNSIFWFVRADKSAK